MSLKSSLLVSALLLTVSIAHAQLVNGDFKNGLDAWEVASGNAPLVNNQGVQVLPKMNLRQEIFEPLKVGAEYDLSVVASASSPSLNLNVGVRFFDAKWKSLLDKGIKITSATLATSKIAVQVPAGAVKTFIYIRSYGNLSSAASGVVKSISFSQGLKRLRYAPPVLVSPITLNVSTGFSALTLKTNQDYILKLPAVVKTGGLTIQGGRNIHVIGGHIRLDKSVNNVGTDMNRRAIYVKNNQGTVHLEGILIEGDGAANLDGIAIAAEDSIVQVQNVRVVNIFGTHSGFHADLIQPFGGVKELRVDKFTGTSYYQGFQLASSAGPIGRVEIHRANVASLGTYSKDAGGQLFWMISSTSGFDCSQSYPVVLDEVYLKPRADGWGLGAAAYPMSKAKDSYGVSCGGQLNADKTSISFPLLPVTGILKGGAPLDGDFVPANVPGIKYVSPGYR